MSYTTGSASNFDDVATALINACVAGGWTNNSGVLTKGDAVVEITGYGSGVIAQAYSSYSGGPLGPTAQPVYARNPYNLITLNLPVTYHIHVLDNPDEVYLLINFNVSYWLFLAFGSSPIDGLPGTGNWVTASCGEDNARGAINMNESGGFNVQHNGFVCPAPFWASGYNSRSNYYIHHGLKGGDGWTGYSEAAASSDFVRHLTLSSPSYWNNETILIPITPCISVESSMISLSVLLGHSRFCRNNYLSDGEVITLGADEWKTYPFYRKDGADPDGSASSTGTMGWAIRYES